MTCAHKATVKRCYTIVITTKLLPKLQNEFSQSHLDMIEMSFLLQASLKPFLSLLKRLHAFFDESILPLLA